MDLAVLPDHLQVVRRAAFLKSPTEPKIAYVGDGCNLELSILLIYINLVDKYVFKVYHVSWSFFRP